jgi:hypothetical protein
LLNVKPVGASGKSLKLAGFGVDGVEPLCSITRDRFSTLFLTERTSLSQSLYSNSTAFDQFSSNSSNFSPLADTFGDKLLHKPEHANEGFA